MIGARDRRGEELEEESPLRAGLDGVRDVRRDHPGRSRDEITGLLADPEAKRAANEDAGLLVHVDGRWEATDAWPVHLMVEQG